MIKEEYVSLEQAKKLMELGFQVSTELSYNEEGYKCHSNSTMAIIACPSLSLVAKWLREEKNIHICPRLVMKSQSKMGYIVSPTDITIVKNGQPYGLESNEYNDDTFRYMEIEDSYEQALSAGINKVLELIQFPPK